MSSGPCCLDDSGRRVSCLVVPYEMTRKARSAWDPVEREAAGPAEFATRRKKARRVVTSPDFGWRKFFSSLHYAVGSAAPPQKLLEGVVSGVCHLRRDSFPDDETWRRFEKLLNETTYLSATGNEGANGDAQ